MATLCSPFQLFLFVAVLINLSLGLSRGDYAPSKLISDVCKETADFGMAFDVCLNALAMEPRSSSADMKELAHITLQLGIKHSTATQKFLKDKLQNVSEPATETAVKQCSNWLEAATDSFKSATGELEVDVMTANYDARIAGDDVDNCQTSMAEGKIQIPEVSVGNGFVKTFSIIATVVTNHLY